MSWNYRIILHDTDTDAEKHWYGLHEVYYDPIGWTVNPISFVCDVDEGPTGITASLERALHSATERPIITESKRETWIKA